MSESERRAPGKLTGLFAGVSAPVRNDDPTRNDGISVGFELIGTPAIFGFFGYLADRALGTAPIIMLASAGIAFATVLYLVIWRYNNDMAIATEEHRTMRESRGPGRARWERDVEPSVTQSSDEVSA